MEIEEIERIFTKKMKHRYSREETNMAKRIWHEFAKFRSIKSTRRLETWAGAVDYLVNRLHFKRYSQEKIGKLYNVSESSIAKKYKEMVNTLKIMIFDPRYSTLASSVLDLNLLSCLSEEDLLLTRPVLSHINSLESAKVYFYLAAIGATMRNIHEYDSLTDNDLEIANHENIKNLIDYLVEGNLASPELDHEVEFLKYVSSIAVPILIEKIKEPDFAISNTAAYILGKLGDERAIEPLYDLIYDPFISDQTKFAAIAVLDALGIPPDDEIYYYIKDPYKCLIETIDKTLEIWNDEIADLFWITFSSLPESAQIKILEILGNSERKNSVKALKVIHTNSRGKQIRKISRNLLKKMRDEGLLKG